MDFVLYKDVHMLGMDLKVAAYKGVVMTLGEGDDWLSIYSCESKNKGKGHVQEMIDMLRKDFPTKRICGSVPMNDIMKHIFDKKRVNYSMTDI